MNKLPEMWFHSSAYTLLGSTWVAPIKTHFTISSFMKTFKRMSHPLIKKHIESIVTDSLVMGLLSDMFG